MSNPSFEWTEAKLATLRGVAEAAGAAILSVYARMGTPDAVEVQRKSDDSPVTEADLVADRLIRARLAIMFDGAAVLSEEGHPDADAFDPAIGYFLVDPLDGTKEFLARNGEFTVNIAWVQGARVLAAVVHAPALGETFWGAAGLGAWKSTGAAPGGVPAAARPIRVAPLPAPEAPLRVLASRSHGGAAQRAFLRRLPQPVDLLQAGSSLKFCRLAEGAADLYPRLTATMAWDTAAGQGVLEAAGGVVLGTEGAALRVPRRPREAPNPPFFAASSAELASRAVAVL
ncbi:MAG: 3'(2'),5'-bisphosphate nucleotidase CysQ [Rubrivivax sp.]|nr:3'(2'),5'-bisphosphate nucleotidase CysQ [Rubrivivax sp.]